MEQMHNFTSPFFFSISETTLPIDEVDRLLHSHKPSIFSPIRSRPCFLLFLSFFFPPFPSHPKSFLHFNSPLSLSLLTLPNNTLSTYNQPSTVDGRYFYSLIPPFTRRSHTSKPTPSVQSFFSFFLFFSFSFFKQCNRIRIHDFLLSYFSL